MSLGLIILLIVGVLIFFGAAQRVLDRLYLSDNTALFVIAAIIAGSFFSLPVTKDPLIKVNIGGALIPVILVIYILSKTGTAKEIYRTIIATVFTSGAIFAVTVIFRNFGEGRDIIDPMYIFALTGGIFAYIFGRTRRGAFIAGTMGYIGYEFVNIFKLLTGRINTEIRLGGAGVFDSIVISGIFAVLLVEIIGETREKLLKR